MSELYLNTTITDRKLLPQVISLQRENHAETGFVTLGRGTLSPDSPDFFMSRTQEAIVFSVVTRDTWRAVKRELIRELPLDLPGAGVSFIVPLSSIGGRRELAFLTSGQSFIREEESELKGTEHELLVITCSQGYSDMIIDAAKGAGATGGTVINARGTGMEKAEQFLGITLATEKEMVMIVIPTAQRDRIMQSVMLKAGLGTPARAIAFSLPVTDVVGLRPRANAEEAAPEQAP